MNIQAPTTTLHHRPMQAAIAAVAALVVAGGTLGVLAVTSDDAGTTHSPGSAVTSVAPDRVLDGSPILRGTSVSAASARVLDGSPILRGHAAAKAVTQSSSVQGAPRSSGRPQGFGFVP